MIFLPSKAIFYQKIILVVIFLIIIVIELGELLGIGYLSLIRIRDLDKALNY